MEVVLECQSHKPDAPALMHGGATAISDGVLCSSCSGRTDYIKHSNFSVLLA